MTCLITCLIWTGSVGHYDVCSKEVKLLYQTTSYNYVSIIDSSTKDISKYIKIEFNETIQQVAKPSCTK